MKYFFLSLLCVRFFAMADTPEHEALVKYVSGANQFHFDLYSKLSKQGNVIYSPYSVSTAMTLVAMGANGETAKQMRATLHLDSDLKKSQTGVEGLIQKINGNPGEEPGFALQTANALWMQKSISFVPDFLDLGKNIFQAELRGVDFLNQTEKTRLLINQWVSDQTKKKIQNLISRGTLSKSSRFVVTNAIYFKGSWQEPFEKKFTKKEPFFLNTKKKSTVDMMKNTVALSYVKTDGVSVVELPYKRSSLAMVLVVPDAVEGLADVEHRLSPETLNKWVSHFQYGKVALSLPKFKMTSEFRLEETLDALGMHSAFSPSEADFSGITKDKISINAIAHKAFIGVDEFGTEAAAATAILYKMIANQEEKIEKISADRPFLFVIRETDSGAILFAGRVTKPESSASHG